MTATRKASGALRFAVSGALAGVLMAGCAGSGNALRHAQAAPQAPARPSQEKADRAVSQAETAVKSSPRDASLRLALAQLYLKAGRFESAATTFEDAMELGDESGRAALGLALSYIANGGNNEAVAVLDDRRDAIAAEDLGLALALAGETQRGVAILADALRSGNATPKLRQNLAYAYALDGRWREARLMMAQDVPADQIDARISQWAMQARPEDHQQRVVALLGVPLRTDSGQPQYLALATTEPAEQQAESVVQPAASESAELPPAGEPGQEFAASAPSGQAGFAPFVDPNAATEARQFDQAFAEPGAEPAREASQQAAQGEAQVASQPAPARLARGNEAPGRHAAAAPAASLGSHAVQLGSFSSPENARRAVEVFSSRYPQLRDYELTITPAVVHGKNYWRVAVGGFNFGSARGMCSSVKARGGDCFAYAGKPGLPKAERYAGGPGLARGR